MASWNYRGVKRKYQKENITSYKLCEVYYNDKDKIDGWTAEPVRLVAESEFELREEIRFFLEAFRQPVLEEKLVKGKEKLVEEKNQNKINSGHYHEYLDRASIALDYIYQFIRCHPLNKRELKLAKQCEKAESELAKLYKLAGDLLEDKKNKK